MPNRICSVWPAIAAIVAIHSNIASDEIRRSVCQIELTLSFSQTLTTNVIRLRCDGRTIQSNTARLPAHSGFLRHNGSNLVVVHLQGDLGFGTCRQITGLIEDLTERDKAALSSNGGGIHAHAQDEQTALGKFVIVAPPEVKPLYIVVCLRNVTSLDYSAAQQLVKMKNAAVRSHAHTEVNCRKEATPHNIVYTRCRPSVRQTLLQCGCVLPHDIVTRDIPGDMLAQMPPVAICDSYMRALAICEDALLRVATQNALVPPQLPLLPDELDTLEMPNLSNIEAERARERAQAQRALRDEGDEAARRALRVAERAVEVVEGLVLKLPRRRVLLRQRVRVPVVVDRRAARGLVAEVLLDRRRACTRAAGRFPASRSQRA